jgi:uncharacterized protein (TIGR02217 family)
MAFHEVQFPPSISQGAVGGVRFSTTIIGLSSGFEHRNINWSKRRGEWDVSHGLKTDEQIEQLIAFFHACHGKAYGFRFKDWADYRVPLWRNTPGDLAADGFGIPVMFTTDGVTNHFQITKAYTDGVATYSRQIQKPVSGSVQVLNNGVQIFSPVDWTVDTTTGIITLSSAIAATTGHTIAVACEYDVPCRFDTDDMKVAVNMVDNFAWSAIPVIEIRDIV